MKRQRIEAIVVLVLITLAVLLKHNGQIGWLGLAAIALPVTIIYAYPFVYHLILGAAFEESTGVAYEMAPYDKDQKPAKGSLLMNMAVAMLFFGGYLFLLLLCCGTKPEYAFFGGFALGGPSAFRFGISWSDK